jgi:rhodanese-related sulfurtransferase
MKKLLIFLLLVACSEKKSVSSLSPLEFDQKLKNTPNAVLIDVRSEAEVATGSLKNARNIVYDDSFVNKISELPKDQPTFLYCAAGKRSAKAAAILEKAGFKEVYQLSGGLNAWKDAKLPL